MPADDRAYSERDESAARADADPPIYARFAVATDVKAPTKNRWNAESAPVEVKVSVSSVPSNRTAARLF
jgi:hypothetical protein